MGFPFQDRKACSMDSGLVHWAMILKPVQCQSSCHVERLMMVRFLGAVTKVRS